MHITKHHCFTIRSTSKGMVEVREFFPDISLKSFNILKAGVMVEQVFNEATAALSSEELINKVVPLSTVPSAKEVNPRDNFTKEVCDR